MRSIAFVVAALVGSAVPAHADAKERPAVGAPAKDQKFVFSNTAMGTMVSVFFWAPDEAKARAAADGVFAEMKRLDAVMTTWTETSEVSKVNLAAGKKPVPVSDETFAVIARAQDVAKRTNGIFDITVGSFKGLWKFDQDMDGTLPDPAEIKKRLASVGYKHLVLNAKAKTVFINKAGVSITLGGIAKGFAVDRCADMLKKQGFANFMIQAGGDMYIAGDKGGVPWIVAIRDPRGPSDSHFANAPVKDHSFSTSGDYERGFVKDGVRYHHILDPRTGRPAHKSRSVTVRAADAFTADAWSKVLFILGYEESMKLIKREKLKDFDVVWIDEKNEVHMTDGMKSVLRIEKQPTPGT
jgi:thiamine biosynthesis lipoprotein